MNEKGGSAHLWAVIWLMKVTPKPELVEEAVTPLQDCLHSDLYEEPFRVWGKGRMEGSLRLIKKNNNNNKKPKVGKDFHVEEWLVKESDWCICPSCI